MAKRRTGNKVNEERLKEEGLEGEKPDQAEESEGEKPDQTAQPEGEETEQAEESEGEKPDQTAQPEGEETEQAVSDRNPVHRKERMVETIVEYLRVRAGAGTHYAEVAILNEPEGKKKQHYIVKEKKGWGLLKEYQEHENGWICLEFTRTVG